MRIFSHRSALHFNRANNILYIVSDYISANKAKEHFEALGKNVSIFVANTDCFLYKKAQISLDKFYIYIV